MNLKKISLFLALAFGLSWLSAFVLYVSGIKYGSTTATVIVALFYMGSPAIAALVVQKIIYKQEIKLLGFDFKQTKWKNFLWIPLLQVLFCALTIGIIVLFGNVFNVNGFGFFSLDEGLLNTKMQEIASATGLSEMPKLPLSPFALLLVSIITSALLGGLINGIFTLGEELGWRGFLYNEMKPLGFVKSNLLIGTIWGLWHAPLILQGHNYPEHPITGVFMMVVFCIPLGFLMSWTREKTNSVLAPALFHGMVNAGAGGVILFVYEYNDLIGNIAGVAGAVACLLLYLLLKFIFSGNKN